MRVVNFLLAIMFLGFAFVQLNDPDPVIWILIYGVMAVTCVMAMFHYYSRKVLLALMVIYAAYSIIYIPGVIEWLNSSNRVELFDDVAKMNHLYIEESREFLGLMICIAVLVWYYFRARKKH
ncbi:transmembrane 220 family protein [Ohtaekwangia sp.]|uniref:transmembrane 220 family protein n=1 Tax=Ohtaekwangia sp. TaxID=2066019 RepID=UPI002F91D674